MQKSRITKKYFDSIVTDSVLGQICIEFFGKPEYDVKFVDNDYQDEFLEKSYNKGRLAILQYHDNVYYISFSDENGKGRNQSFQSVATAFNRFYFNKRTNKKLCFYFLPCSGNDTTNFHMFMYRLMKTVGFEFINVPQKLAGKINGFSSIDDLIRARKENGEKNKGNKATYIVKNSMHDYEIFGKTYGANKYDTSMLCYAISKLIVPQDNVTLYEYKEKDLKVLPKASLKVLQAMGNINIVNVDDELEINELVSNDSLRSPRFNSHLLVRLGARHCVLCDCQISEIIQGAHIWPVADIKKIKNLSQEDKLAYATDGENGLWMCQNHHKMFDADIIKLSREGEVIYKTGIDSSDSDYIHSITTITTLPSELITDKFKDYIDKRYMS